MSSYNHLTSPVQAPIELRLSDEIVASPFWALRQPLQAEGEALLWKIVEAWKSGLLSSTEALAWLDNEDMLDPNDLMTGFVATHTARAK